MAIVSGLMARRGSETRSALTTVPTALWRGMAAAPTATGRVVTPETALAVNAVYACIRVLAEGVGSLPLHLYEKQIKLDRETKRKATEHPIYNLLNLLPNPELTSIELRETLTAHCALRGNGYGYIHWGSNGYPTELWPLRPDRVTVARVNGELLYSVMMPDETYKTLTSDYILHIRGLSYDGVVGMSPIELARQSVALTQAAEEFGARFFGNDARPGAILSHPMTLSDEAYERLRNSWNSRHGGLSNAQKVAILEEGMDVKTIGISPDHAQFLETRKFQVNEIARLYRVPPHMIQDLERATFSNIEHQDIGFVRHTLRPWLTRWEQAVARDMLLEKERGRYFAGHQTSDLLRGDLESRYKAYAVGRQQGFLSANDIRQEENMTPIEGGDQYLVPLNMVPVERAGKGKEDKSERLLFRSDTGELLPVSITEGALPGEERGAWTAHVPSEKRDIAEQRQGLASTYLPVIRQALGRVLRREANDVLAAANKHIAKNSDGANFRLWLREFYQNHHSFYERHMRDVMLAYAALVADMAAKEIDAERDSIERFVRSYVSAGASRHVARQEARVNGILDDAEKDVVEALQEETDYWRDEEGMAAREAAEEVTRSNNAVALAVYAAAGRLTKRWVSVGDSCQYCSKLNGQVIAIYEWYVPADGGLTGLDGGVLNVTRNIGHPPVHGGCDCMVVAG